MLGFNQTLFLGSSEGPWSPVCPGVKWRMFIPRAGLGSVQLSMVELADWWPQGGKTAFQGCPLPQQIPPKSGVLLCVPLQAP